MNVLSVALPNFAPLHTISSELTLLNQPLPEFLMAKLPAVTSQWQGNCIPDQPLLEKLRDMPNFRVVNAAGEFVGCAGSNGADVLFTGFELRYPWDLLFAGEYWTAQITENRIEGELSPFAHVDGVLHLGSGSRVLPGVYVEGKVIIGKDCKIGPNCYLRGNTVIGDRCHVGQAVEIKNSILGVHTSVGHLSYAGDCVIGDNVNFGAGTIISNLRHDGRNHRSMVNGQLVETGRRKFGAIIGDNVHTGIHTAIYPGRKLFPGTSTRPGQIVQKDLEE